VAWVRSIANYNAIYRRDVLAAHRYDEALVVSDDNEVNYRIAQSGYRFRFVREAKIYHRETGSVREFTRNMFAYGMNIANAMRKHRVMMRPFVPFALGLLGYLLALPLLLLLFGPLPLVPLAGYALLGLCAVIEVLIATRTAHALLVALLFPLQHLGYGAGVLVNLVSRRVLERPR
jgi:GT2 family glycosyltransferase